jgi:hypothetical protein
MSAKLKRVKIFGEGVFSRSPVVTRQRRLNCYLEIRKDQDKASIVCYGTPGLKFAFNAATPLNNPARGLVGNNSALYAVAGNVVKSLSSTGSTLQQGTIGTSAGLVGMALNPTQLMIVDGSAGYVFNPATGAVTVVGGAFPAGALTVAYCNGFFICEDPGTNQFFVSNLNDGTTWNGLSFAAAVQAIDGIMACDTLGGLLIIFSAGHVEFWQNQGSTPEPFVYIQNSATMYGLEAIGSRVHCGDSLLFLAHTGGGSFQNSSGSFQIARIKGYSVDIVSTTDIDAILQSMARSSIITDCTAFSYQIDTHMFAQFNFPTANRSLLLDTTTGIWSEVQSGVTTGYAARHLGNLAAGAYNKAFIADYSNGNLYNFDPGTYTDNGNPIVRELVTPCAVEDFNTFRIGQILLDMRTGVGLSSSALQGYNPTVQLSIARDNRDFGMPRSFSLGKQGQYWTRVISRRWGRAKQANLKIRMTDPVPFEITSGVISTKARAGAGGAPTPQRRAA